MRAARSGVLIAAPLLLFWGGLLGCSDSHEDCDSIAPGTPVSEVPVFAGSTSVPDYCHALSGPTGQEELALRCCALENAPSDGGFRDCSALGNGPFFVDCATIPHTELRRVGAPYSDWECQKDEGYGPRSFGCYVWVRDGGVIGACGGCPPD
jgi:hypothetical protein